MEKKQGSKAKTSFESALKELEKIAQRLEEGNLGLDESIAEFERGTRLTRFCHEKLEEAERKIEILQKGDKGNVEKKGIRVKENTGEIEDDEDVQGELL